MIERPRYALEWAVKTFTPEVALNPQERIMRFIEEAIELAHAMNLDAAIVVMIVARVYSRDKEEVAKEIGQTLMTLECLAKLLEINADEEASKEFNRVQKIPQEEWD